MKKRLQFQGFGAAHFAAALVAVFTFALSIPAAAQWVSSTTANNTVGVAGSEQRKPLIIADGQGGSIIVWEDDRASATERTDIYAQKLDARGNPVWAVNGVLVCAGVGLEDQILFNIASDEQGGVLVVWKDGRGGAMATEYYIQRILANGTRNWGNGGVPIENVVDDGNPTDVAVAGFGTGGAIVAWTEGQNNQNLKVQRFEDDGSPDWGPNIIRTDVLGNFAQEVQMINDGAGGVIITWSDERSGNFDIYAQRVLISSGALGGGVWSSTPNGISLHAGPQAGDQIKPHLVRNGAGGAIAAWDDVATTNIYAATITQTGALFGNIPVCTATGVQSESQLTVDGNGGAIITWSDQRGGNSDIYAQRLISSGTVAWILNGVAVCTIGADQNRPAIVGDKDGGAIISWTDARISTANTGIYAQHLRSDGTLTPGWLTTGVAVGTAGNNQLDPVVAADETGGAVVAWSDERSGAGAGDIFASLVGGYRVVLTADGGDGSLRQAITSANLAPGRIHFAIPASPFTITPATILPSISGEGIVVDGYSQIGSSPNTLAAGSNANILVEINTTASGGFNVSGDNVKIRGLSIFGSGSGSGVFTLSSSGLSVDGCFLGLRADGTTPGALGNGVNSSGSNLLVGGPNVADRNVITGNTNAGILSSDGINLTITNNIIGLDKTGEVSVGAQPKGISIAGINSGNILIGGALAGQGNLISNNSVAGIDFTNITNAANTRVFGNIIGLDKNATNRPTGGSQATGINSTGSQSNVGIGGVNAGEGNTISGNTVVGVSFNAGSTVLMSNIRVQGNSIGLQKNGSSPITSGSQQYGVQFNLSVGTLSNAIVGDNGLGGRNTIADNTADGLDLNGAGVGSVLIGGNSIYNNAQKGIRLSGGANAGI
ncbi:MAG: hypothetical protein IAF08_10895, partial [Rhizobacter sp.]|nr:hypothetical protein [Chlorobiales bacterium]